MKDASASLSPHRWLQLPSAFPTELGQRTLIPAKLRYHASHRFLSADVLIESSRQGAGDFRNAEIKIEFEAKVPLRAPFRYCLRAKVGEFETIDLEKKSIDTWAELELGYFKRTRAAKADQILDLRAYRLPPILLAPFVLQALNHAWDSSIRSYLALVLAGSRVSLVVIRVQAKPADSDQAERTRSSRDRQNSDPAAQATHPFSLEITIHAVPESELSTLENWQEQQLKSLDMSQDVAANGSEVPLPSFVQSLVQRKGHRLNATYSSKEQAITRLELRLPVLGALALSLESLNSPS